MTNTTPVKQRRPYGNATVRQEIRKGKLVWGYDKTLRQPDGKLKRFRNFSFRTKADAAMALDELKLANTKPRHVLKPAEELNPTTVKVAVASYQKLAAAKLVSRPSRHDLLASAPRSSTHVGSLRPMDWPRPTCEINRS